MSLQVPNKGTHSTDAICQKSLVLPFNGGTNGLKSILFDRGACWMVFQVPLNVKMPARVCLVFLDSGRGPNVCVI